MLSRQWAQYTHGKAQEQLRHDLVQSEELSKRDLPSPSPAVTWKEIVWRIPVLASSKGKERIVTKIQREKATVFHFSDLAHLCYRRSYFIMLRVSSIDYWQLRHSEKTASSIDCQLFGLPALRVS